MEHSGANMVFRCRTNGFVTNSPRRLGRVVVVDEYHTTKTCSYHCFGEPSENIVLNELDSSSYALKYPPHQKNERRKVLREKKKKRRADLVFPCFQS